MYDAIIIGARCAGAPTAMLLARKGHRVLLVDRDTFPSDTLSTSYMQADAVRRLSDWGLMDRVVAAGAPPITGITAHLGGMTMPPMPGGPVTYAPRRTVLDAILVDGAREAGAEVREGFSVQDLVLDAGGAVVGAIGASRGGEQVMEECRVLIGADGCNSFVARQVGAEEYRVEQPASCGFFGYFKGVPTDVCDVHFGDHFIFYFPSAPGEACVGAEAPLAVWDEFRRDPGAYLARLWAERAPEIAERVKGGTLEGGNSWA